MPVHDCILAYSANVECFLINKFSVNKGQNNLDVTIVEAVLQCKWNMDSKASYKKIMRNKELFRGAK